MLSPVVALAESRNWQKDASFAHALGVSFGERNVSRQCGTEPPIREGVNGTKFYLAEAYNHPGFQLDGNAYDCSCNFRRLLRRRCRNQGERCK